MFDTQSSGRLWGWPMLALVSLGALLAGSWWLVSDRRAAAVGLQPPEASSSRPPMARPARLQPNPHQRPLPHPASRGVGETPHRQPAPLQSAAAPT